MGEERGPSRVPFVSLRPAGPFTRITYPLKPSRVPFVSGSSPLITGR